MPIPSNESLANMKKDPIYIGEESRKDVYSHLTPKELELDEMNCMTSFVFDELDKKPYPKKPYPAPHVVVLTCPSKEERAEREAFERSVMISILKGKEQRDRSMQKPCRR